MQGRRKHSAQGKVIRPSHISSSIVKRLHATKNLLFAAMHDHDMDAEISAIRIRSVNQVEKAAKQLFQVVKDHNNPTIQEMLDISNVYCYRHAEDSSDEDLDDEINPSRFFLNINDHNYLYLPLNNKWIRYATSHYKTLKTTKVFATWDISTYVPIANHNYI